MSYRTRIDLGVACIVIAIGLVFLWQALLIDPKSHEAVGPRAVPMFLAVTMIVLGAAIGIGSLGSSGTRPEHEDFGFGDSDILRVAAIVAVGAVFLVAFWAAGYMLATAVAAALSFRVFGVRSPVVILSGAVAASIAYQALFMGLMGLFDPRGELLDLRMLSRLVTPGS